MVYISDMTMNQTEYARTLSFKEKIELAKLLDKLGVDVITVAGIHDGRTDALRIKSIASAVEHSCVAVPVELNAQSVEATFQALQQAKKPRLQVCAPVSTVQMEYLYHRKPEAMLGDITSTIAACANLCETEFVADDATRSDPEFLYRVLEAAVEAGAKVVTLCDTAGTMLPEEFGAFVEKVQSAVPQLSGVRVGVACSNALSMADGCAVAAVCRGVSEIKAAVCPVDCVSLPNIAKLLAAKEDAFGPVSVHVNQLSRIVEQIVWMCQTGRSKGSPFDTGVQEDSGMYLTSHDNKAAVEKAVATLGYDLSDEDMEKVYAAFVGIAAKKAQVSVKELDAIVASAAMQVPEAYKLDAYVITSGNNVSASAHIRLYKKDVLLEGVCLGDGSIDAAFMAIEQITGCHYELDDFQIQAVTEGREAMGQTVVKLRSGGKVYSGRGISTDIVGASIYAYLSALNKIAYEEDMV